MKMKMEKRENQSQKNWLSEFHVKNFNRAKANVYIKKWEKKKNKNQVPSIVETISVRK